MPPAQRWGDLCSGHSCFPPSNVVQSSTNVFINNLGATRITDAVMTHCCGICHGRAMAEGSHNVYVNNLKKTYLGHRVDCGGVSVQGSPNVIING